MASILVVDDDEATRTTLYDLFSAECACQTAESAEKAIALLAAHSYDVVLTDISMPGLSGLELLGHVLQKYPQTPVIVFSWISDKEHAEGLIKLGAFDYLLKPFKLEVLEECVKRAVEHRRQLTEGFEGATAKARDQHTTDRPKADGGAVTDWKIVKDKPSA